MPALNYFFVKECAAERKEVGLAWFCGVFMIGPISRVQSVRMASQRNSMDALIN